MYLSQNHQEKLQYYSRETQMNNFPTFKRFQGQGYHISETIQSLWSGYGQIVRLKNDTDETIVVKFINPPSAKDLDGRAQGRLRTANSSKSHQRKLQSYQVELQFYQQYAQQCNANCKVPKLLSSESIGNTHLIVLEDLFNSGFPIVHTSANLAQIKLVLNWLAHFHAIFMNHEGVGLWSIGTYWHLTTRKEEFNLMQEGLLKQYASEIDLSLNSTKYKTILHGDAKLANFCFAPDDSSVAAVDFQYVGKGCGMKDFIYFIGSCLSDKACEKLAPELLDYYFCSLSQALETYQPKINQQELEEEWRSMYAMAWADFHRFLLGWMPTHQKLTAYSQSQVRLALNSLKHR